MIGTVVGPYRILAKIGEGGMGAVYRAEDEMLERQVAIKVLRPELSRQKSLVERFRTEAIALARLNHPNIATVHGLLQQGTDYFMVLEYVPGETLESVLARRGPLEWHEAVRVAKDVLNALDHAHSVGVVHRDLKPANLMLTPSGAVKVMDFGIARMAGTSRHTEFGRIVGTPLYMSPEQLRGEEVDGRSDLYSLAIVLFELLTGREAFVADSDYALLMAQLNTMPDPPSRFVVGIPMDLDRSLERAMAKSRDQRWPNAKAFRKALATIAPEPVTEAPEQRASTRAPVTAEQPVPVEWRADPSPRAPRVEPKEAPLPGFPSTSESDPAPARSPMPTPSEAEPVRATRLAGSDATAGPTRVVTDPTESREPASKTFRMALPLGAGLIVVAAAVAILRRSGDEHPPAPPPVAIEPAPVPPAPAPSPTSNREPAELRNAVAVRSPVASTVPPPAGRVGTPVESGTHQPPAKSKTPDPAKSKDSPSSPPAPPPATVAPVTEPEHSDPAPRSETLATAAEVQSGGATIAEWIQSKNKASIERTYLASSDVDQSNRKALLELLDRVQVTLEGATVSAVHAGAAGQSEVELTGTLKWRSSFGANRKAPVRILAIMSRDGSGWRVKSWKFLGKPDLG